MQEMLMSEEFKKYRRKEFEKITKHIWQLMCSSKIEEAKGCLDIAHMLLKFPEEVSSGEGVKRRNNEMIREFQVMFLRIDK